MRFCSVPRSRLVPVWRLCNTVHESEWLQSREDVGAGSDICMLLDCVVEAVICTTRLSLKSSRRTSLMFRFFVDAFVHAT